MERQINVSVLQNEGDMYDYFDELLERIRKIRASERIFYQKLTDILPKKQ